jgi:hypothetical protein
MITISVEISGITPLICNRFHDEAAQAASSGSRSASAAQDRGTPLEIASKKLYLGGAGGQTPIIPQPNLLRCLIDGGRFEKVGKAQVTTAASSMLFAFLDIEAAEIEIQHQQPWRVDTRAVVIPSTKGRVLTHRPMFDDWRLAFEMRLDTGNFNAKLMRRIVDHAGSRVGLGDFRPARKGPYGRFAVVRWEERDALDLARAA